MKQMRNHVSHPPLRRLTARSQCHQPAKLSIPRTTPRALVQKRTAESNSQVRSPTMASSQKEDPNSLLNRMGRMLKEKDTEEYLHLSLEQLGHMTIKFGKTKVGQTFERVMTEDPKYVHWFLGAWQDKNVEAHKPFLHYVEKYLTAHEKKSKKEKPQPKAAFPIPPTGSENAIDISSHSSWSEPSTPKNLQQSLMQQNLETQDTRISHIEQAVSNLAVQMQQMVEMLSQPK